MNEQKKIYVFDNKIVCGIINNGVYVTCQKQTSFDAVLKFLAVR